MLKVKFRMNNLLLFIVLFLAILPVVNIGSFEMPVLYLLLPILFVIFIFVILGLIRIPKIIKVIIVFFILIILEIIISSLYGTITVLDKFVFPTDAIQYISRLLFIVAFGITFFSGKIAPDTFIKYFLIILNVGMIIGVLQWIPWPGREMFIKLYPFRDGLEQLSQLNRPLHLIRVHGVAQMATANGGLSTFFFVFGYSVYKYHKNHKALSVILIILSCVNIFACQARAGILSFLFSLILFYYLDVYISRKRIKPTLHALLIILILCLTTVFLYNAGNPFVNQMVYRWINLFETGGGSRVDQTKYFFSLINSPMIFLFGISKQVVNESAIPHGVEIEPINIFITYGAIGFIIQYSLVITLLFYSFRRIRKSINNRTCLTLLVSSFVGLFSYQIFSVAYYFFREIRVGLFPWILMGVTIGVYEKYKKDFINEEIK